MGLRDLWEKDEINFLLSFFTKGKVQFKKLFKEN